jgi:hypothetical protein
MHAVGKFTYQPLTDQHKDSIKLFWTPEQREKTRCFQMSLTYRRIMKHTRSYVKLDGTVVLLDSSWEEALAKRLDELHIEWERPKPIQWVDSNGRTRNYFPDFYLPLYQLYLDPKNYGARKLSWLEENRKDVIILNSLEECISFTP